MYSILLRAAQDGYIVLPTKLDKGVDLRDLKSSKSPEESNQAMIGTFIACLSQLGYYVDADNITRLLVSDVDDLTNRLKETLDVFKTIKGADVEYTPMYVNFPQQVIDMDEWELYLNAIVHYASGGQLFPYYDKEVREVDVEKVKVKELTIIDEHEYINKLASDLLSREQSLTQLERTCLLYTLGYPCDSALLEQPIKYKETLMLVASYLFVRRPEQLSQALKTGTDVLRFYAYLSGFNELLEPIKFKTMPRKMRRLLVNVLNDVLSPEDVKGKESLFTRMFHALHVGEYKKATIVNTIAKQLRSNKFSPATFNSKLEKLFKDYDSGKIYDTEDKVINLVSTRAGVLARNFLRLYNSGTVRMRNKTVDAFCSVIDKIPMRLAIQVLGLAEYYTKKENLEKDRFAVLRGSASKVLQFKGKYTRRVLKKHVEQMRDAIKNSKAIGDTNVTISPEMYKLKIPSQLRNMNATSMVVGRGSRLPMGDKNTIRFFIYWVGRDVDLSAVAFDENLIYKSNVSWTHLRSGYAHHSGDITQAPNGASEFIDIDVEKALAEGVRYISMNVYSFSRIQFNDIDTCYAGYMMRDKPASNEIYDARTVEYKFDLNGQCVESTPLVFDLKTREVVVTDINSFLNNISVECSGIDNFQSEYLRHLLNNDQTLSMGDLAEILYSKKPTDDPDEDLPVIGLDGDIKPNDLLKYL